MPASVHPVDDVSPLPEFAAPGLRHVIAIYANAVAAPLARRAATTSEIDAQMEPQHA